MSLRTTLITFGAIFALGVILIVVLPFLISGPPSSPSWSTDGRKEDEPDLGVFRSDDGGGTWQAKYLLEGEEGSIASFRVNRLVADPVDPAALYLLTDGSGLWVSKSRGELWAPVADQGGALDRRSNVLAMAVNPAEQSEWYVAVFQSKRGRVLHTRDGGKTFAEIYSTPVERFGVFDVFYDRSRGAAAIATGQGGLLETFDRGRTWRVRRWFADGLTRLLVNPVNPALRFVATSRGSLFRTEDYGENWADLTPSLTGFAGATAKQSWAIDAAGTLYLGSKFGLLRSFDNAATFAAPELIVPPEALPVSAVAVDPRDSGHIVAAAGNQIYLSRDGGKSWAILAAPGSGRISHLLIDRAQSETIYALAQP